MLYKKGALRNFTKFTGKLLCQSLFFNKVAGLRRATLLEKRPWHKCFSVNFVKLLKNTFFHRTTMVAASKVYSRVVFRTLSNIFDGALKMGNRFLIVKAPS